MLADQLTLRPNPTPASARTFAVDGHPYLMRSWLPILGPSATVTLMVGARLLEGELTEPGRLRVPTSDLCEQIGLVGLGKLSHTVMRLARFRLAELDRVGDLVVGVDLATRVPLVEERLAARLPRESRRYHDLCVAGEERDAEPLRR